MRKDKIDQSGKSKGKYQEGSYLPDANEEGKKVS